jgi:hypothetical protein
MKLTKVYLSHALSYCLAVSGALYILAEIIAYLIQGNLYEHAEPLFALYALWIIAPVLSVILLYSYFSGFHKIGRQNPVLRFVVDFLKAILNDFKALCGFILIIGLFTWTSTWESLTSSFYDIFYLFFVSNIKISEIIFILTSAFLSVSMVFRREDLNNSHRQLSNKSLFWIASDFFIFILALFILSFCLPLLISTLNFFGKAMNKEVVLSDFSGAFIPWLITGSLLSVIFKTSWYWKRMRNAAQES